MNQLANNIGLKSILTSAPGNPLLWNQFLSELCAQLNCSSSALLVVDLVEKKNTRFLFSHNISPNYQKQYENGLNALDTFNSYICKNPQHVFYKNKLENTKKDDVFFSPSGQGYRFGLSIPCNHNHALNLLVYRKKPLKQEDVQQIIEVLQSLAFTLKSAIHEEQRHKINSQLPNYIGDHFDGYIIIDKNLNILFSDPVYTAIINQMDCVQISNNKFGMKNPLIEQKLLTALMKNQEVSSVHNQCHSCQITLIPIACLKNLYQWECYKDGFILSFIHDKDSNPTIQRLIKIYRLSKCEANCALHFMKSPSISEVANITFRSQETVRNHIKHTMQKMDVHTQAELMKELLTLAAL